MKLLLIALALALAPRRADADGPPAKGLRVFEGEPGDKKFVDASSSRTASLLLAGAAGEEPTCKWLWLAGMHEGANAVGKGHKYAGYRSNYAAALLTARETASVLQPVLMLGRRGLDATDSGTESHRVTDGLGDGLSKFGRWAQRQGALVFNVERLAFQEHLDRHILPGAGRESARDHAQGPYLRLHAPVLIREHNLITEGICSDVFLYTDCDTLFLNIDAHAMIRESERLSSHVWSFGPQAVRRSTSPLNTGVMLINYTALESIYSDFISFGVARNLNFRAFDQGWIIAFSAQRPGTASFLEHTWNYKVYWGGNESTAKIVHFHGPKPGRGQWLECLASQNARCMQQLPHNHPYTPLVSMGFKADGGHLAHVSLERYKAKVDSVTEADGW